jgi:uncharacterized protein
MLKQRPLVWFLTITVLLSWPLFLLPLAFGEIGSTFALIAEALPPEAEGLPIPLGLIVALQIIAALTIAPLINTIFAMGEELGWRGYLLPQLMPLGKWRAILLSSGRLSWSVESEPAALTQPSN